MCTALAAWAALAGWITSGAVSFTGGSSAGSDGARIGVLPRDPAHALLAAAAGAIVFAAAWRAERPRRVLVATAPLILLFLPWLPFRVPPAFLVWTGALASIVWVAVAISLAAILWPARVPRALVSSPWAPGLLAALIFSLAAWGVSSVRPGGDEPHYLIITQSLLLDGDLRIANNHRRGDYRAYFAGDLPVHAGQPGRNREIYSIHAPGLPALVLPAFALGGYRGVVMFLIAASAAGSALAWWLAWRVTGSAAAAWFGWAGVTTAAPFLLESFTVFPDGPGAVLVLTGFWALLRADTRGAADGSRDTVVPWMLHGLALALLPWMHTRFAVLAGTLGGLILVRIARVPNPLGKAVAFLAAPAVSALAWLFFFTIVYGAPDPSAPYGNDTQNSLAYFPNGLGGLLFDQGFGLFATAPVLLIAVTGFTRARRLAAEWLVVALPYLLAVATFAMWWAGLSGPARFLVPLILPLAIPLACAWESARSRAPRALMIAALIVSALMSALMAGGEGGRLAYHTRNEAGPTVAPFLERASHVVDLPAAFPAFVPQPVQPDPGGLVSRARATRSGFTVTLIWALCLGAAAMVARRTLRARAAQTAGIEFAVTMTTLAFGAGLMIAASIVWRVYSSEAPVTAAAAQMNVLRKLAAAPQAAVGLVPLRRMSEADAWGMRVGVSIRRARGVRANVPLAAFPAVPAGSYLVSARRHGSGDGWVMLGVGNDQFAIVTQPLARYDEGVRVDLPIDVRALLVRADEGARAQLDAIDLRPVARAGPRLSNDAARRAVRYDTAVVFFLDDRAFPEPSGFWVAGERTTRVVVRPDAGRAATLSLRNGAVENTVVVESGAWRENVGMHAGEERRIDVPLDEAGAALLTIRSTAGFRPSDVNSDSRDPRFLGVFVRPVS